VNANTPNSGINNNYNNNNRNVSLPANSANPPSANTTVNNPPRQPIPGTTLPSGSAPIAHSFSATVPLQPDSFILLKTANAFVRDDGGQLQPVRLFLDTGSQVSSMTERCADRIGLRREVSRRVVSGFAGLQSVQNHRVHCDLYTKTGQLVTRFSPVLTPEIIPPLPTATVSINNGNWEYLRGLPLADSSFWQPREIDVLLSARECAIALFEGLRRGPPGYPSAQNSVFGWLLFGEAPVKQLSSAVCAVTLDDAIERFWRIEEISSPSSMSSEETSAENHFRDTHYRLSNGRYGVRLPLKRTPAPATYENSKRLAAKRFFTIERKGIPEPYQRFMTEYENLGHMTRVGASAPSVPRFFLPHHPVYNTEKIRVVFDASAGSEAALSLNAHLANGPNLQTDIFSLLLRLRSFRFVICTDIVKMFRQIEVHPDDRKLQCIWWRESPESPLRAYELNTVTYGTVNAPFLAMRTLRQLASDESDRFPNAATVIRSGAYMDDLIAGAGSRAAVVTLVRELCALLAAGGFELSKWSSNDPSALRELDLRSDDRNDPDETAKVLGLRWSPSPDALRVNVPKIENLVTCTKRVVASATAKIFDPLGLLSPFTLTGKILMQELWKLALDWDTPVPPHLKQRFENYVSSWPELFAISVPRYIIDVKDTCLFCFCDASQLAYAACIYACSATSSHLLAARAKVAPLQPITIPRLELCGAELLTKLLRNVLETFPVPATKIKCYTDSEIVLAWLKNDPEKKDVFTCNRLRKILDVTTSDQWSHVRTHENPADLASRGATAAEIVSSVLWWSGPPFVREIRIASENAMIISAPVTEPPRKREFISLPAPWSHFSSYPKILRVIAWCRRFIHNRFRTEQARSEPYLSADELRRSEFNLVRLTQSAAYEKEITMLRIHDLPENHRLSALTPFLDDEGVLRIEGRLRHLSASLENRCPAIIPSNSEFAVRLIEYTHESLLHAGSKYVADHLRRRFWIAPNARRIVRTLVSKCVRCLRYRRERRPIQLMGHLPSLRVSAAFAFQYTGVDYAGPILTYPHRHARSRIRKSYIALFTCLSTRAVHLEGVSDMTTEAFLAAFHRFVSRRGRPAIVVSDNGRNFVGAAPEIKQAYEFVKTNGHDLAPFFANEMVQWRFNTPHTPHQGGVWESLVKSVKTHYKKVVGNQILTFEEFQTLLTQVEGCVNSRPLTPMSSDPEDTNVLTPGHFLIGRPITDFPSHPHPTIPVTHPNLQQRWRLLNQVIDNFWKRWKLEYLHTQQTRQKRGWRTRVPHLDEGELVVIKDISLPPTRWHLGRVLSSRLDDQGIARVYTLKTNGNKVTEKHAKYLIKLPVPYNPNHSVAEENSAVSADDNAENNAAPPLDLDSSPGPSHAP